MAKRKKQPRNSGKSSSRKAKPKSTPKIRPAKSWTTSRGLKYERYRMSENTVTEVDRIIARVKAKYPTKRFHVYGQVDFHDVEEPDDDYTNNTVMHDPDSRSAGLDIAGELSELSINQSPAELDIEIEGYYVTVAFAR